jgi:hypothetical protein
LLPSLLRGLSCPGTGVTASGRVVPGHAARVADGIRTRDIQIHNLVAESSNDNEDITLRQTHVVVSHHLPTDICQSNPDLELIIQRWPNLPDAVKASIVMLVEAATDK